jgi:hypothetical protein
MDGVLRFFFLSAPVPPMSHMSDLIASARLVPDNDNAASAAHAKLASILALQTGLAAIAALYVAREVIVCVTVAILLSFVLTLLVDLLRAAS